MSRFFSQPSSRAVSDGHEIQYRERRSAQWHPRDHRETGFTWIAYTHGKILHRNIELAAFDTKSTASTKVEDLPKFKFVRALEWL